jgi:MFS family permease
LVLVRTYGEVFRTPEFTSLFVASSVQTAASTISGLGLGTLVYSSTRSPLLSALAMFGPSIAQVAGASALLSAADRLPPRAAMTWLALVVGLGTAALAIPAMTLPWIFAIDLGLGVVSSLRGGVRFGLLNEILPPGGYLLGRSVLNMSNGLMQICGYAAGGVLVTVMSPRGTLLAGAGLYLAAAAWARLGLTRRPPRAAGRASVRQTWRTNARLLSSVPRRYIYLALWVPNGLIVGCESLFVSYSPGHAGTLFACTAVGMLAGDTLAGRFVPQRWRDLLSPWLRLLLAGPYLVFLTHPAFWLACIACTAASVGYAASLMLQQRLMALTPDDLAGHALGLQSSGTLAMQGAGAALAGLVAEQTGPGTAMAVMAAISVAVTLILAPGLRSGRKPAPVPATAPGT